VIDEHVAAKPSKSTHSTTMIHPMNLLSQRKSLPLKKKEQDIGAKLIIKIPSETPKDLPSPGGPRWGQSGPIRTEGDTNFLLIRGHHVKTPGMHYTSEMKDHYTKPAEKRESAIALASPSGFTQGQRFPTTPWKR
jgi:hypothetical protein